MTRLEALERLLDQIAVSCDTLATFAAEAAERRSTYDMHAVQAMAERMGAMACLRGNAPIADAARHLVGDELTSALLGPPATKGRGPLTATAEQ